MALVDSSAGVNPIAGCISSSNELCNKEINLLSIGFLAGLADLD
jgi:hypothetical protein|tara:strand:+ start:280 stop:411 length:132 start_codon:yes stop_codon:yes gene_type:complete